MPVLDWIGKDKVINHHLDVPYHVLDRQYSYDVDGEHQEDNESQNMIIHGDNLVALKSLLPKYEGKVDCIYIDPPYNTGEEHWVYNDNVNDPRIKKWLGEVVGKEGEDLSRHDKWLCMMYPRLKLLQRMLSDKGAIFISIGDDEEENLLMICDEIFGNNCFVANVSWQKTYSPRNDSKSISEEQEHILVYSRHANWSPNKLPRTDKMDSKYKNPDNDVAPWRTSDAFAPDAATHQGMVYAIQHPFTGDMIYPYAGAHWPLRQSDMLAEIQKWGEYELKDLDDADKRAEVCGVDPEEVRPGVMGIVLSKPIEESSKCAQKRYDQGKWPKFFFTNKGKGGIARKTYLKDTKGRVVTNFWSRDETGDTDEAKKEIKTIFDGNKVFDTPKPVRLIHRILQIATDKDSIVLDSFAGSGTTAQAVLNINKEDGSNRHFVLIEMEDYANSITAERVKRAITGFARDSEEVLYEQEITTKNLADGAGILEDAKSVTKDARKSGEYSKVSNPKLEDNYLTVIGIKKAAALEDKLGGDFSYYELGEPLFVDENLNKNIEIDKIREYIYFMDTKNQPIPINSEEPYLLGVHIGTAYYFYYDREVATVLNRDFLHTIKTAADDYVIYADLCMLSDEELEKFHITFKKIPRDISRL